MKTTPEEKARLQAFLDDLTELTRKHKVTISPHENAFNVVAICRNDAAERCKFVLGDHNTLCWTFEGDEEDGEPVLYGNQGY